MSTPINSTAANNATLAGRMFELDSMSNATHGNAKALFGILFIQYCSYAFFYIMDHIQGIYPDHFVTLKKDKAP